MKGALQIVALVAALALPLAGQAQTATPATTFDAERLELNPSGTGSAVVGSAELLPPSTFRSAVIAHYENEPLVFSDDVTRARLIRERLTLHLTRQYSVAQRVELAVLLPIVVYQSGDDPVSAGFPLKLSPGGLASPILSARVGVLRSVDGAPFDLALQFATALPFGNPNAFARNPGFTLAPRVIASMKFFDAFMLSAEGGGLLRPPVTFGDVTIHNELSGNVGIATIGTVMRLEAALRGGYYFAKAPSSLEAFFGGRYALNDRIDLTAMVAYGASRAPGTPLFRVLFGASFLEGTKPAGFQPGGPGPTPVLFPAHATTSNDKPVDPKTSGASTSKPADAPTKTQTTNTTVAANSVQPANGTATTTAAAANKCIAGQSHDPKLCPDLDLDGDGLKNSLDTCPAAAEDKDSFQDTDGCPDPDNDGDGLKDADDKCPLEAGPADRGGCAIPDQDKDGVEDLDDACPAQAGPKERKGCPLTDSDGDGILDSADGCPSEKGPLEARGCPVKDTDGDKVPDHLDNCKDDKGTEKNHGCPAAEKQLVFITREKIVITDKVYFATNKSAVLPRSFPMLKQLAKVLKDHSEIRQVIVEGHTDNVGNAMKNLTLSRQRAEAVRRYLILNGVNANRLQAKGYGQSRPLMPNISPRGRDANRRVEFRIVEAADGNAD